jgi:hypothetical protein
VELYGNADEGAIRAEELVNLFSHGLILLHICIKQKRP